MSEIITPEAIRTLRTELGLSRHDVEQHTGLSGSAVWRAEQSEKQVMPEVSNKIYTFLVAVTLGEIKIEKKAKKTKQTRTDDATTQQWMDETWKLRKLISEAHTEVLGQIKAAQAKKASTKGLKALGELLKNECTACSSAEH